MVFTFLVANRCHVKFVHDWFPKQTIMIFFILNFRSLLDCSHLSKELSFGIQHRERQRSSYCNIHLYELQMAPLHCRTWWRPSSTVCVDRHGDKLHHVKPYVKIIFIYSHLHMSHSDVGRYLYIRSTRGYRCHKLCYFSLVVARICPCYVSNNQPNTICRKVASLLCASSFFCPQKKLSKQGGAGKIFGRGVGGWLFPTTVFLLPQDFGFDIFLIIWS